MKAIIKLHKNHYPKTVFSFTLIEVIFIKTIQVIALNITICNIILRLMHEYPNGLEQTEAGGQNF